MAKKLTNLVIHCTATPEGREVSAQQIKQWHTAPKPRGRGWSRVGYSDLIELDGTLVNMREYNQDNLVQRSEMTWGVRGKNGTSRHVVYVGGLDSQFNPKDTRTDAQKKALETYVKFQILRNPNIKVSGHYHFSAKACPCFDVEEWLKSIGIEDKNIYSK
jgi:N-acetylmuramoyl-L-alanine amidase